MEFEICFPLSESRKKLFWIFLNVLESFRMISNASVLIFKAQKMFRAQSISHNRWSTRIYKGLKKQNQFLKMTHTRPDGIIATQIFDTAKCNALWHICYRLVCYVFFCHTQEKQVTNYVRVLDAHWWQASHFVGLIHLIRSHQLSNSFTQIAFFISPSRLWPSFFHRICETSRFWIKSEN